MAKVTLTLAQQHTVAVVLDERKYQDNKWGPLKKRPHEVGTWLVIMDQLLEKAKRNYVGNNNDTSALDEIRQVVAVGFACMEQHGCPTRKIKDDVKTK